jgi:hypothetical protein
MTGRGMRLMEAQATWIAREQAAQYNFLSIFTVLLYFVSFSTSAKVFAFSIIFFLIRNNY